MENDKFQELVIAHLKEISTKLKEHDERFDRLEAIATQHHEDLEKVATQVEKLVINDNELTAWVANRVKRG
jgi:predicted nuclease with TOPRIM domain